MKKTIIILSAMLTAALSMAQTVSIADFRGNKQAAVSLTFDDGLLDQYTLAWPVLRQHGLKATFGIIGSKVGREQKGTPCMTWEQLREMAADGQEVTSHGYTHKALTKLSGEALRQEIERNDSLIEQLTGQRPLTFLYPFNHKNDTVVELASRGRLGTRTFQVSMGSKRDTMWIDRWLNDLVAEGKWGVTMTHGIVTGYDHFHNPDMFRAIVDRLAAARDSVWITPLRDVAAYVRAREATTLTIMKSTKKHLVVKPQTSLKEELWPTRLTLVVDSVIKNAHQDGDKLEITLNNGQSWIDFNPFGGIVNIKK